MKFNRLKKTKKKKKLSITRQGKHGSLNRLKLKLDFSGRLKDKTAQNVTGFSASTVKASTAYKIQAYPLQE